MTTSKPSGTGAGLAPMCNVPAVPLRHLSRDADQAALRDALVSPGGAAAVGIAGVHGMGGIGKTVLATALAHDEAVRRHFVDGIYWITAGRTPEVVALQGRLARMLGGAVTAFGHAGDGQRALTELFAGKRVLLILDDVWDHADAAPFACVDPAAGGRVLITTRDQRVLRLMHAAEHWLDVLSPGAALALLGQWVDGVLPPVAADVARACGYLPLALATIGAMVQAGDGSWSEVLEALQAPDGLADIAQRFPDYPHPGVLRALAVSVEALDALGNEAGQCCVDLAVFAEDEAIPEAAVKTLWSARAPGMSGFAARKLLNQLVSRSLATRDEAGRLGLHDLMRMYLQGRAGGELAAIHGALASAYLARWRAAGDRADPGDPVRRLEDDTGYLFRRLLYHLVQAGRDGDRDEFLWSYDWMASKLAAAGVVELCEDYWAGAGDMDEDLTLVGGALTLSSHVLARDPGQLPSQLVGRLRDLAAGRPRLAGLLSQVRASHEWLCPGSAALTPPGGPLVRTLIGHKAGIWAVAVTKDGRQAVSASEDGTLKVWDLEFGIELCTLTGHAAGVMAVAVTGDARAVSASEDGTLKVWDLEFGIELCTLTGHEAGVMAVAITPDGKCAVSASVDRTLKVWDLDRGCELRTLSGHSQWVKSVGISPDGNYVVSASNDATSKVWVLKEGKELHTVNHSAQVNTVAVIPGRKQVLSASWDHDLMLWEMDSGKVLKTFYDHSAQIRAVIVTPDEAHAICGLDDGRIELWSLQGDATPRTFTGHSNVVTAVALITNSSRIISASLDGELKIWNTEGIINVPVVAGYSGWVWSIAMTPDGSRAVSASDDEIRVWDVANGKELRLIHDRSDWTHAVSLTGDGKCAVSASGVHVLRVWDLESGCELCALDGHSDSVNDVAMTPDGTRAISVSDDRTLKLWDLENRRELRTLDGHRERVVAVAISSNAARAVSASLDKTVMVWDLVAGTTLHVLTGHSEWVWAVAMTPDGARAISVSDDNTARIWDLESGSLEQIINGEMTARTVAMTADGGTAIFVTDERNLNVWRIDSNKPQAAFVGGHLTGAKVVTGDGHRAVSASQEQILATRGLASGRPPVMFSAEADVLACAASSAGDVVMTSDSLGRVHILRLIEPGARPLSRLAPVAPVPEPAPRPVPDPSLQAPEPLMAHATDPSVSLEARLARLLGDTFAADELRRFLRHAGLPGLAELTDDLPEPGQVAKSRYMADAAEKLVGRGLVTPAFLQAWAAARPGRAADILALASPSPAAIHATPAGAAAHAAPSPAAAQAPAASQSPAAGAPVTYNIHIGSMHNSALHTGTGDQTVAAPPPDHAVVALPDRPEDAVLALREDILAIEDLLVSHYKAVLSAGEDAAREARETAALLGRIVDAVESRLPGPVTEHALKQAMRAALIELDAERGLQQSRLAAVVSSGVSQSLLASLIVEALKLLP